MGQRGEFALLAEHVFKCNRAVVGKLHIVLHVWSCMYYFFAVHARAAPGKAEMAFNGVIKEI